jgi:hypothetical protein
VIRPAPPQPDEGPEPERMTAKRLAARIHRVAEMLGRLRLELRSQVLYIGGDAGPQLDELVAQLSIASLRCADLAAAVKVGRVRIEQDLVDGEHTPERPILDQVETAERVRGLDRRLNDDDRERIAARGDTAPGFDGPLPGQKELPLGGAKKTKAARKKESRSRPQPAGTLTPEQMKRPDVAAVLQGAATALHDAGERSRAKGGVS